mmetsp:Transcript_9385/g.28383  ORF Transcript_9385/g.28383 Transcript_9385/m.28383 type:complete len:214 (+) Transcript_9385:621-1262(+)
MRRSPSRRVDNPIASTAKAAMTTPATTQPAIPTTSQLDSALPPPEAPSTLPLLRLWAKHRGNLRCSRFVHFLGSGHVGDVAMPSIPGALPTHALPFVLDHTILFLNLHFWPTAQPLTSSSARHNRAPTTSQCATASDHDTLVRHANPPPLSPSFAFFFFFFLSPLAAHTMQSPSGAANPGSAVSEQQVTACFSSTSAARGESFFVPAVPPNPD